MNRAVARAAVFGSFDGVCTALGLLLGDPGHGLRLARIAAGVAAAGAASMAGGEYVSTDPGSPSGPWACAAMGAATGVGTMLPAVPFVLMPGGWLPLAVSLAVSAAVAAVIAVANTPLLGARRAWTSTFLILCLVLAATVGVQAAFGAVG